MRTEAPHRRVAAGVAGAGAVVFLALAVWLVPWDPVPGGALRPPAASDVFSVQEIQRGEGYSATARLWSRASLVVALAVACVLGFTSAGRRLVGRLRGPWWIRVVQAVVVVEVVGRLATLPIAVRLRAHQREWGLSEQPWSGFARDVLVREGVALAVTCVALVALVGAARRWRRWWPAVGAAVAAAFVGLGSFAYPVVFEPMFNSFAPLEDDALGARIHAVAAQEGVAVDEVLVADASRRTTTLNAYVSGIGSTRRVVLYDNLLAAPEEEVVAVVAHELAHAKHHDVVVGTALGAAGSVLAVGLLGLLLGRRRHPADDPGSVPRILALVAVGSLLAMPVQNTISRQVETRADVTALLTTGEPAPFVDLQRRLAVRSLADPSPAAWSQFWFGSHPTVLQRIAIAERVVSS